MSGAATQTQVPPQNATPPAGGTQQAGAIATMTPRPQPSHHKPLTQLSIGEMLNDPRVKKMLNDTATKHLNPERMLRVIANAIRKVPKLSYCTPMSLLGALITCQTLGLEPNTPLGHAYLIPFDKRGKNAQGRWEVVATEVNLIIGYQGLIDLVRRTGNLVSIHADVVYDGDDFSFEYGSNQHLRHVPRGIRTGRTAVWAYAHAKLSDGEAFEVLPYAEIMSIRDATEGYKAAMSAKAQNWANWDKTPWIQHEAAMACKTMVRRLAKWLPKSIEFANALEIDEAGDRAAIDFGAIAMEPGLADSPDMVTTYEHVEPQGPTVVQSTATPQQSSGAAAAATQARSDQSQQQQERQVERTEAAGEQTQVDQVIEEADADNITRKTDKIIAELANLNTEPEIMSFEQLVADDLNDLPVEERRRYATAKTERIKALKTKK